MTAAGFDGLVVVSFESRRASELATLIAHHGGEVVSAPSMREVPLEENPDALRWAERLLAGEIDLHCWLTGVGTRTLVKTVSSRFPLADVVTALGRTTTLARGPKPVAALRELGLAPTLLVPEPNTWRELLATLDAHFPVAGKQVSVQEYGVLNLELLDGLEERGARVMRVPVYAWALPLDTAPLRAAVCAVAGGRGDVLVFTNANQVSSVLRVAAEEGVEAAFRKRLDRLVVASIGPTCSEALRAFGFPVDCEPVHPKMGTLIHELAIRARALLAGKQMPGGVTTARAPVAPSLDPRLRDSPFLRACRRESVPFTPVWLMRQAGRYMPEYRALRGKVPFLELCKTPELACAVTVEAAQKLGVDAAIIFSDLLVVLEPMGAEVTYTAGDGPVITNPVRETEDVDRLREVDPEALGYVYEAVRLARAALPVDLPLIGFAGAPFTLACYLIEGGASRNYEQVKVLMYREPRAWHVLLEKLARGLPRVRPAPHPPAAGARAPDGAGDARHPLRHRLRGTPFPHARGGGRRGRSRLARRPRPGVGGARPRRRRPGEPRPDGVVRRPGGDPPSRPGGAGCGREPPGARLQPGPWCPAPHPGRPRPWSGGRRPRAERPALASVSRGCRPRDRGRRRSAYEAPHGTIDPGGVARRRRIEA